jgi:acyl-CoA thioester hydrolase
MGHLNTRHYAAMFDDASMQLLSALGFDFAAARGGAYGWADVRAEIDLLAEVPLGGAVVVESGIVKLGNSSLTTVHRMLSVAGGKEHARYKLVTVYFDLGKRAAHPIPEHYRAAAQQYRIEDTSLAKG